MSGINASAAKARSAGVLAAGGVSADCAGFAAGPVGAACSALGNGGLTASASSEASRILRRIARRFISATPRAYPSLATPWAILTGIAAASAARSTAGAASIHACVRPTESRCATG